MTATGAELWIGVLRASFDVTPDGQVRRACEQTEPRLTAEWRGDAGTSSLLDEADLTLPRQGTDVLVTGHAHAPGGRRVQALEVSLQGPGLDKRVRVHGPRAWQRAPGNRSIVPGPSESFERVALTYENAFGGSDPRAPEGQHPSCAANPVGTGFCYEPQSLVQQPAPQLEHPNTLLAAGPAQHAPAGFGPIAAHWQPRAALAGTYDEAWTEERAPLLPADYEDAFVRAAPADQHVATGIVRVAALILVLPLGACDDKPSAPQKPTPESQDSPSPGASAESHMKSSTPPAGRASGPSRKLPMLSPKPVLSARLDLENCAYQVFLNGGLVAENMDVMPAHQDYPVNHWLRSGRNVLEVLMFEGEGEPDECDVKVSLQLREHGSDAKPGTLFILGRTAAAAAAGRPTEGSSPEGLVDAQRASATASGQVWVGPATIQRLPNDYSDVQMLRREFEVTLPFPEWAFFQGDEHNRIWDVKDAEGGGPPPFYYRLLDAYQAVWELLKRKDLAAFLDACEERSREMDLAYYKASGETRKALRSQIESVMNDPEYELATVKGGKGFWYLGIGTSGKLLYLTQGARASPIIRYQLKGDTPFSIIIPVVFRTENGKYIVTR